MLHPLFSEKKWKELKERMDAKRTPLPEKKIFGSDKDPRALEAALHNLKVTGFESIELTRSDVRSFFPTLPSYSIFTNPPYGKRVDANEEVYRSLGRLLHQHEGYVLTSGENLVTATGLAPKKKWALTNGGIPVELNHFS